MVRVRLGLGLGLGFGFQQRLYKSPRTSLYLATSVIARQSGDQRKQRN